MKAKLTEADKFYIQKNWKDKTLAQLSENTGCKEKPIQDYVMTLTDEAIEALSAVGKPLSTKGATVMNETASMAADDFAKLPRPDRDTSKHIHHCKDKPEKKK